MRYVEVGGTKLSVVGLGTWQFGSREWGYGSGYADKEAGLIVRRALELGINLFDTAEIYGFGRSERILGRALEGRRPDAFIATKIFPVLPVGPVVAQRAQGSLRRLGVERIDLYQLHQPNPIVPLGHTMTAMGKLVAGGSVAHVGVSNYSLSRWQAAEEAMGGPVLSNQVQFSLVHRGPDAHMVPWAQSHDRLVVAYSPLAQGLLSGRYDAEHLPSGAVRRNSPAFLPDNLTRAAPLIDVLRQVAAAHDATPAQVALAWLVAKPNVVVIPGASSIAQVEKNAAAADIALGEEEIAALTAAAERYRPLQRSQAVGQLAAARVSELWRRVSRQGAGT